MRATIVVDDGIVVIDGKPLRVDCSPLADQDIHAVQWYDNEGEVEFKGTWKARKPNRFISDFSPYQQYVDLWHVAKMEEEKEIARLREEEERARAMVSRR
jgi:hypothetical protein